MLHAPEAWTANTGVSDKAMIMTAWGVDLGHSDHPTIETSNCGGTFGSCNGTDGNGYQGNLALGAWVARQNGVQAVGVAPGVVGQNAFIWRIVPIDTNVWYFSTFIDGINQAVVTGVRTLLFVQFSTTTNDANASSAVSYAWNNNVVMVAGIYGTGTQVVYPAAYSQVIGISGVLRDRSFANSSNPLNECGNQSGWGAAMTKASAPWTATIATSTVPTGAGTWCGGAIAAAYGAGVVSLIRSQNPTWTPTQVRDRLLATAAPVGDAAHFGSGIVNATAALTLGGSISGPSNVRPFVTCNWSAIGLGGNAPYTFNWYAVGSTGSGQWFDYFNSVVSGGSFSVQLQVTDATGSSIYVTKEVSVNSSAPACNS